MSTYSTPFGRGGSSRCADVSIPLEAALRAHFAETAAPEALTEAVRRFVSDSKACQARVEEVIMAFKRVWYALPEAARCERNQREALRTGLVTYCINEFYATR